MNRRVVGVALVVCGALAALAGTFLPLYVQIWDFDRVTRMEVRQTSWTLLTNNGEGLIGREALFGVPIVVGVSLAILGAVRSFAHWGRLAAFGGALMVVGGVWATAQYALGQDLEDIPGGSVLEISTELGTGVFLMAAAAVLVVVGALLVQDWPEREPEPESPVVYRVDEDETDTPPFGIPVQSEEGEQPIVAYEAVVEPDPTRQSR